MTGQCFTQFRVLRRARKVAVCNRSVTRLETGCRTRSRFYDVTLMEPDESNLASIGEK